MWNQASSPLRKRNVTGTPARVAMRCGFFVPAQCRRAWVPCKRSAPLAGRIRIRPDAPCASAVGRGSDTRGDVLNWAATPDSSTDEERSEEHTSELQSLMRNSYAVFCLKKKQNKESGICTRPRTHIALYTRQQ